MKNVLWLAGWYPNQLEPLAGDFIERHAKAASLLNSISVIHVVKDHLNVTSRKISREKKQYNNRSEATIVYYKVPFKKIAWLNRSLSAIIYVKQFIREATIYISRNGKPDLVHVHISQKAAIVALYLKWFYHIPYVISEQWTGFCPGARPNFDDLGIISRLIWRIMMKHASGCSTVSDYLGIAMRSKLKKLDYDVIPNVVDTTIFKYSLHQHPASFRFIHVSTLRYQKNVEQMFEAIRLLSLNTARQFELVIYGPPKPAWVSLAKELNIQHLLTFKNETDQMTLAQDMQQADALVLYSRYETFGCVIIEANACGLPVVVSDIPVLHENVLENVTGVFAPLNKPDRLADVLLWMMENRSSFRDVEIADLTNRKYGFQTVGELFDEFYEKALGRQVKDS